MCVQISYDIVGAGWAKCTIRDDDAYATVTASYLSAALDDLTSAVAASLRGHPQATASFTAGPGVSAIRIHITDVTPAGTIPAKTFEVKGHE